MIAFKAHVAPTPHAYFIISLIFFHIKLPLSLPFSSSTPSKL